MRELEFLPEWYPRLRRKRRVLAIQSWLAAFIVATLGLWVFLAQKNVHAAGVALNTLQTQVGQANAELKRLDELQQVQQELTRQADMLDKIGPHIPVAKLIEVVDQVMPKDMGLLDLTIEPEEHDKAVSGLIVAAGGAPAQQERSLHVTVHGVAPTDLDLGQFLVRLADVPHLSDVAGTSSKALSEAGHSMREFEVAFDVDLSGGN